MIKCKPCNRKRKSNSSASCVRRDEKKQCKSSRPKRGCSFTCPNVKTKRKYKRKTDPCKREKRKTNLYAKCKKVLDARDCRASKSSSACAKILKENTRKRKRTKPCCCECEPKKRKKNDSCSSLDAECEEFLKASKLRAAKRRCPDVKRSCSPRCPAVKRSCSSCSPCPPPRCPVAKKPCPPPRCPVVKRSCSPCCPGPKKPRKRKKRHTSSELIAECRQVLAGCKKIICKPPEPPCCPCKAGGRQKKPECRRQDLGQRILEKEKKLEELCKKTDPCKQKKPRPVQDCSCEEDDLKEKYCKLVCAYKKLKCQFEELVTLTMSIEKKLRAFLRNINC